MFIIGELLAIYFTSKICNFNIVWNTLKAQSLFPLKNKVDILVVSFTKEIAFVIKIMLERYKKYYGINEIKIAYWI